MSIKYSKEIVIKQKVFKEDAILRIAKLVHEQFHEGDYEEYDLLFDDQSSISGKNSIDVFRADEFKQRRSERIWLIYRSNELNNQIEIKLYNSFLTLADSTVEISRREKEWYQSICNEISTIIDEEKNQKINIILRVKYFSATAIGIIEGLLLSFSLNKFFLGMLSNSQFALAGCISSIIFLWINLYFFEGDREGISKYRVFICPSISEQKSENTE